MPNLPAVDRFFPFFALGYRRNPFGVLSRVEWQQVVVLPPLTEDTLVGGFDHLQLIGPKGRGKTSHLLALTHHFDSLGKSLAYEYIAAGTHRFTTRLNGLQWFLIDEAQRLSPFSRWWMLRAAARGLHLIVATHRDLAPLFIRHGLNIATLSVDATSTRAHLQAVLDRRLVFFARDDHAVALSPDAIDWLWERFGTDLRATENVLYEAFQQRASRRDDTSTAITVQDLAALDLR